jgi:hypothetical protein
MPMHGPMDVGLREKKVVTENDVATIALLSGDNLERMQEWFS